MKKHGELLNAEQLAIVEAVRRSPAAANVSDKAYRLLVFLLDVIAKGERPPTHAEIAEILRRGSRWSTRTVVRYLRELRHNSFIRTVPKGAAGADYTVVWDVLAAVFAPELSRQKPPESPNYPGQKPSKSSNLAVFSRAQELDLNTSEDNLSPVEIKARTDELKGMLTKARISVNGYVMDDLVDFARDVNTNSELWEEAARVAARAGPAGKRFDYFLTVYQNKVETAAAASFSH